MGFVAALLPACSSRDVCARRPWECNAAATAGAGGVAGAAGAGGATSLDLPAPGDLPAIAELPDPFLFFGSDERVESREDWTRRRAELRRLAEHYEYGALPPAPEAVSGAFEEATLTVRVSSGDDEVSFAADVALPQGEGPFPAFIQISAGGPVAAATDFTSRGYAFLFLDTGPIAADSTAAEGAFYDLYPDSETGVLMAWAWGVHRTLDALEDVDFIDTQHLAVHGFSRWGKAALLAGAFDERIALTVPSSSGLSGTGQYRFFYEDPDDRDTLNEKIGNAWSNSSYWFTDLFGDFVSQVERLPFDQHAIMALVAPRALLPTQGRYDYWTNPRGTSISWRAALPVFEYLGAGDAFGVVWDDASHELSARHVAGILEFADWHLMGKETSRDFHALPAEFEDEPDAHPWEAP